MNEPKHNPDCLHCVMTMAGIQLLQRRGEDLVEPAELFSALAQIASATILTAPLEMRAEAAERFKATFDEVLTVAILREGNKTKRT